MAATSFQYSDPYLKGLVTVEQEDKAIADLATIAAFASSQLEVLVPLRTMLICCQENVKAPDDIFSTKYKMYERDYKAALEVAKAVKGNTSGKGLFSILIERA